MRFVLSVVSLLVLVTACAFSHDDEGHLYPPDRACADVQACFSDGGGSVVTCVGQIPEEPDDYDGALWACFEASGCLLTAADDGGEVTTRQQFEDFLVGCFGAEIDGGHPLDAIWRDSFWAELEACLVGSKASQQLTIDVCYE